MRFTDGSTADTPAGVAERFNDRIGAADLDGLAAMMAQDHVFIDTAGTEIRGREACVAAWREFFAMFPGYRNVFASVRVAGSTVTMVGHSEGSSLPELNGPAIWTAEIRGDRVAGWRVWEDTAATRAHLRMD